MGNIKPIATHYNGYRFRSRLEARWAVFFDAAGIEYEYEPEGYVLSDGTCYLPDFYLPWFHMYVEIKPGNMDDEYYEEAKHKLEQLFYGKCFSEKGEGIVAALMIGDPYSAYKNDQMYIYVNYLNRDPECIAQYGKEGATWREFQFIEGGWYRILLDNKHHEITFGKHYYTISVYGHKDERIDNSAYDWCSCLMNSDQLEECRTRVLKLAYEKAKKSRFEHGECG